MVTSEERARIEALNSWILNEVARSPLADIPWPLITAEQIARVMRGEIVHPTSRQRRESSRLAGQFNECRPLPAGLALDHA